MIDLDSLAREASRLEPLPASVTRLAGLVCDGTPEILDVVEIVEYDQALTAALLRMANSSWSASREQITTVRAATVRLGTGPVLSLALGVNVRSRMQQAVPEYGMAEWDLWNHSVAASIAADEIARLAAHRPPPETATAALLHDVGKLVIARYLDREALECLDLAQRAGLTRMQAEIEILGVHHAELGALIAQTWGLPDTLVRGIREHHDPPGSDPVAHGVHLADIAAALAGYGAADDACEAAGPVFERATMTLGLAAGAFDLACERMTGRFDEVREHFG